MLIQCLIEREGDTHTVRLEGRRYKFERNEHGAMVCDVHNQEHIRWMLMSSSYREYKPGAGQSPELKTPLAELIGNKTAPAKAKRKAA